MSEFFNLYSHGFARVAVGMPQCRVADPEFNAKETIGLARKAAAQGAALVAFPELGLSTYTCGDLFHQRALLDACLAALADIVAASTQIPAALVVGIPLRVEHRLFNCAVVVAGGRIHGVVPKSYLPNYGEFYEARQFNAADAAIGGEVELLGQAAPFGTQLLFNVANVRDLCFHVEICEDVWVPVPPSSYACMAGATVLVNLSASNALVGKAAYRNQLVSQQSARCLAAYLYTSAGFGESTTDMAWDGQGVIYENGELLAEAPRFVQDSHMIVADVDLERLSRERMRMSTFGQCVRRHADDVSMFSTVTFDVPVALDKPLPLTRAVSRFPYVPSNVALRDERCTEVYNIQVQGLEQRLRSSGIQKVVIGVSGGLDSTHALLVCAKVMDRLQLPRTNILAYTMPGFATSSRTLEQAHKLMEVVGCTAQELDIRPSCMQMLADLGHPFARGEKVYDVTFENVQAGERTSHLFRLANHNGALVIGTGDLSELALGWCTYGVGDHMSHYNVNASVPKTLISHLVRWVAETGQIGELGSDVLEAVLDTHISPELVPGDANAKPEQKTEDIIGPYELNDFNLFYTLRHGYAPSKVAFLAWSAWQEKYALAEIKRVLRIFVSRFFKGSQFKRSCVPDGPKVGTGGSLSPRGDWRAPSDSDSAAWLKDLDRIPDQGDTP
ncbi:MAG: NAD(+) synthase [Telluria sp.]